MRAARWAQPAGGFGDKSTKTDACHTLTQTVKDAMRAWIETCAMVHACVALMSQQPVHRPGSPVSILQVRFGLRQVAL